MKDVWKQKSTAQAIVVPCSAENSLAMEERNGYNTPCGAEFLLHRAGGSPAAGGRELALPAAAVLFCFHRYYTTCLQAVQPALGPSRVLRKVFNLAFNRQECPQCELLPL